MDVWIVEDGNQEFRWDDTYLRLGLKGLLAWVGSLSGEVVLPRVHRRVLQNA